MAPIHIGLAILAFGDSVSATGADMCSVTDTGFRDEKEHAVACYVGSYLVKTLEELEEGRAKSAQHVRYHLIPWLGGQSKIDELLEDYPYSNCSICYANTKTAGDLTALRAQVPSKLLNVYDSLEVCFMDLATEIMDRLPTDEMGTYLVPPGHESTPFQFVRDLLEGLFRSGGREAGLRRFLGCPEWPDVSNLTYPVRTDTTYVDPCNYNNHGIDDPEEAAVFCYLGSFMQVMLSELTQSPPLGETTKTQQHVWTHMTPWCGSNATTYVLETDNLENETCVSCYNRTITYNHFMETLTLPGCYTKSPPMCSESNANVQAYLDAKKIWDGLDVCYVPWSNYFMEALPRMGRFLLPPRAPETPFSASLRITREIVQRHGVRGCGREPTLI